MRRNHAKPENEALLFQGQRILNMVEGKGRVYSQRVRSYWLLIMRGNNASWKLLARISASFSPHPTLLALKYIDFAATTKRHISRTICHFGNLPLLIKLDPAFLPTRLMSPVTQPDEVFPQGKWNHSSPTDHVQFINPARIFSHRMSLP